MTSFYEKQGKSVISFQSKVVARLQKNYEEKNPKPFPMDFKSRLDGPSVTWQIFKRLNMATVYANTCTKDSLVFSYEDKDAESTGRRLFLVTHPKHLWPNHKLRLPLERCTYEVIQEDYPCKLYFDLEFLRTYNTKANGDEMTSIFIQCVIASLKDLYDIDSKPCDALWLDASTEEKYSCHLIFQLDNVAFRNNVIMGSFVSGLLASIRRFCNGNTCSPKLWPPSSQLKKLFIITKKESNEIFCDEGVYTKNRNFRLYLSTKLGKKAPLVVCPHNQYVPQGNQWENQEELLFLDSLITFFRKKLVRLLDNNVDGAVELSTQLLRPKNRSPFKNKETKTVSNTSSSPFPYVDSFILSIVTDGQKIGYIRKWTYFDKEQFLLYDIGNYRYCSNVGRHHKSNNIMIIVELKTKCYYQKCYDPLCRVQGFKSEARPLPESLLNISYLPGDFDSNIIFSQLDNPCQENIRSMEMPERINEPSDSLNEDCFELITAEEESRMVEAFEIAETKQQNCKEEALHVNGLDKNDDVTVSAVSTLSLPDSDKFLLQNLPDEFWVKSDSQSISSTANEMANVTAEDEAVMVAAAEAADISFDVEMPFGDDMLESEETVF